MPEKTRNGTATLYLSRMRFGMEVEAVSGPEACPLGARGTDHGGAVLEYRLGPVTLLEWSKHRAALRKFFSAITVNPEGNPPTGLHIHVEVPHEHRNKQFFARLSRLWAAMEKDILAVRPVAVARRIYASEWTESHCFAVASAIRDMEFCLDRRRTLNLASIHFHGTVEFRLWNGTNDFAAVEEFLALCLSIVWVVVAGCGRETARIPVEREKELVIRLGKKFSRIFQKG
ncbi:amidoligase family protein [Desulfofundulus australicus]|nr:amidoligase family protein [Desulfofundulus australicus]